MKNILDITPRGNTVVLHTIEAGENKELSLIGENGDYIENLRALLDSYDNMRDYQAAPDGCWPRLKIWYYESDGSETNKNFNHQPNGDWTECSVFGHPRAVLDKQVTAQHS